MSADAGPGSAETPEVSLVLPAFNAGAVVLSSVERARRHFREVGVQMDEIDVALVEFIHGQEEWLRQELSHLWTPLFLALQEALTLYYREIEELGLPAAAPTLEVGAITRPQGLEMPLLVLEPAPGWRFAREVWLRSGLGFLGRAWVAVKQRLRLGGAEEPRSPGAGIAVSSRTGHG